MWAVIQFQFTYTKKKNLTPVKEHSVYFDQLVCHEWIRLIIVFNINGESITATREFVIASSNFFHCPYKYSIIPNHVWNMYIFFFNNYKNNTVVIKKV